MRQGLVKIFVLIGARGGGPVEKNGRNGRRSMRPYPVGRVETAAPTYCCDPFRSIQQRNTTPCGQDKEGALHTAVLLPLGRVMWGHGAEVPARIAIQKRDS